MKSLLMFLVLFSGDDFLSKKEEKITRSLNIQEAEAIVHVYETKLRSSKIDVRQCRLQRDHCRMMFDKKRALFMNFHAVTENDYLEWKLKYDLSELEVEQQEVEVEEAERNLVLSKIRLQQEVLKDMKESRK